MAANLTPQRWDWPTIKQGKTFPAMILTESESETPSSSDLVSVAAKFKLHSSTIADIELSSGDGITINTATAGSWEFTIDEIPAATTAAYDPGIYQYELSVTDAAGIVQILFDGTWTITTEIP